MDISKDISTEIEAEISEETAAETPKNRKGDGFKKFLNRIVGGDEQNVGFHFVLIMFFVLVAINMAFSFYTKVISVYNDELFYMNIAHNIFNGNGAVIDVLGGGFDKILYSLILVPTFLIKDAVVRVNVISVLNCVVISSSIFPVWLIEKDIKLSKKNTVIALIITLVFPEFAICTLFMSEVLYIPLVLWFIHRWFVCSQRPTIKNGVIMGVVGYLCYFTKEVFLAVPVACVALELVYPLIAYWTRDDKSQPAKIKDFYSGKKLLNLIVFLASFAVIHFAVKLIFFGDSEAFYNVGGFFTDFFTGYNIFQTIYQVVYYIAAVMIAVLIVPVVYPILRYRVLDDSVRKLYCFCITSLLAIFAVTALTVGRSEMVGVTIFRVLSRYFSSFVLLLLILFLKSIEKNFEDEGGKRGRCWGVLLLATVSSCFLFRGGMSSAPDTALLDVYRNFKNSVGELSANAEQTAAYFDNGARYTWGNEVINAVPLYAILFSALIVLFVVGFHALFTHRREHQARMLAVSFVVIIMLANGISSRTYQKINSRAYSLTVTEVLKLNDYLDKHDEPCNILYLLDGKTSDIKRAMDTYLDHNGNQHIYPVLASSIDLGTMKSNDFRSDKIENEYLYFSDTPNPEVVENYDYIIVDVNANLKTNRLSGIEKVDELDTIYFTMYRNIDPSTVLLELDESKAFNGEDLEIHFTTNENTEQIVSGINFGDNYYNAAYYFEVETLMSVNGCFDVCDYRYSVKVPVVGDYSTLSVKIEAQNTNAGYQPFHIEQGQNTVCKGVIYGHETVELTADVENGYLSFDVTFSNMPVYDFYTYNMLLDGVNMTTINSITVSAERFSQ